MGFGGVQVQMAQVIYAGWVERNCVFNVAKGGSILKAFMSSTLHF